MTEPQIQSERLLIEPTDEEISVQDEIPAVGDLVDYMELESEHFEETLLRDDMGRLVFPSREEQMEIIDGCNLNELCPPSVPSSSESTSAPSPTTSPSTSYSSSRPSRPAGGGKGAQGLAINGNKLSKDAAINKRWKDWKLAQCLEIQKEF